LLRIVEEQVDQRNRQRLVEGQGRGFQRLHEDQREFQWGVKGWDCC